MQADSYTVVDMLPTVVQTHLPALRALHKSIGRVVPVPQLPRSWPSSAKSSAQSSPPLEAMATREDTSQLDLGPSSPSSSASSVVSMDTVTDSEYGLDAGLQLRTETLTRRRGDERPPVMTPLVPTVHGDGSGVKWQYARQGTMLHTLGSQQGCDDGAFIRKSFIDGVSYLLRALPDNLDKHELAIIEQSLPTQCLLLRSVDQQTDSSLQMYQQDQPPQQQQQQREEGPLEALLRHAVRKAALQFVLVVYLFARLVTVLIRMAAHYEAKYNISSQVFEHSVVVANGAVQCGVMFAEKIGNTGDGGRLGQALARAGLWTLDLMTGAIQEGLSEGIQAINHQPQPSSRTR